MLQSVLETRAEELPVNTGVEKIDRSILAELLGNVLASTYVLYHKTHAFHWNVTGPLFYSIHQLTDEQYNDLAEASDKIAERIRAIGFPAPIGLANYIQKSAISDVAEFPDAGDMVHALAKDHQAVADQIRQVVKEAEAHGDVYTADLLTSRIGVHEEAAWMLNATLVAKAQ